MKLIRRIFFAAVITIAANLFILAFYIPAHSTFSPPALFWILLALASLAPVVYILIRPAAEKLASRSTTALLGGCELLWMFLMSATATAALQALTGFWTFGQTSSAGSVVRWLVGLLIAVTVEAIVFWSGMVRLYALSVQLGIKHRVLGVIFAWVPIVNLFCLVKLIQTARREADIENDKLLVNTARAKNEICKTKYPILLVHGVFFRDFRYLNYWGRIPGELQRNGASVYYGEQQSADCVEDCGQDLAVRIRAIVEQSGCGKVNIIAHSKGGLDCRAAIARYGAAPYVASLTTINTPHRGCMFAEYLLEKLPASVRDSIADTYNTTLKKLGDSDPDFIGAVTGLTATVCEGFNEITPDDPGILYESVMSYCKKARSGKFPLNVSYPLVKHFDGKNDGLVAVDSARWGSHFTLVAPKGARGISHGDMIDLNRENIPGFDVREFYVKLVSDLKRRGY